jgi:hypothetical protein
LRQSAQAYREASNLASGLSTAAPEEKVADEKAANLFIAHGSLIRLCRRCLAAEESAQHRHELWQILLDNAPDQFAIDRSVAMHQDISKRDDPAQVRYLVSYIRIAPRKLA